MLVSKLNSVTHVWTGCDYFDGKTVGCLVHALQPGHNLATFCKLVFTASALSTRLERHHACRVQQYIQIVLCTFWLSGLYLQLL